MLNHSPAASRGISLPVVLVFVVVVGLALWGVVSRLHARTELSKNTVAAAFVTVATVKPTQAKAGEELVLPGSVQAWSDAPVYARTSGYVRRWLVDIGAPVKAGQLLAEIDAPEVDEQWRQAQAQVNTAQANASLADTTATRWKELFARGLTARQEVDNHDGDLKAKQADLAASQANLARLRQLTAFKRIVAPFDGVVTARNVDVGTLINAGAGGSQELFHVAAVDKLRIYVQVPQAYAGLIAPGLTAELHMADRPGEKFAAKVVSTSNALEGANRTLLTQLEFDNAQRHLLPGVYADVHFKLPVRDNSLSVPANTLLFRAEGLQVATLGADNRVLLKGITLGRDFGSTVEVAEGLSAADTVVLNPPDSLANGQAVQRAPAPKSDAVTPSAGR